MRRTLFPPVSCPSSLTSPPESAYRKGRQGVGKYTAHLAQALKGLYRLPASLAVILLSEKGAYVLFSFLCLR